MPYRVSTKTVALALPAIVFLAIIVASVVVESSNPDACALCHRAEADSWKFSTHKDIRCAECHQPSGGPGYIIWRIDVARMVVARLTSARRSPVRAHVASEVCAGCHNSVEKRVIVKRGIRMEHASVVKAGIPCTECHNEVVHGKAVPVPKTATMDKCTSCHKRDDKTLDCNECHLKLAGKLPTSKVGSWAVLHGDGAKKTHGMGDLYACGACHERAQCRSCHAEMPHPEGWAYDHAEAAMGADKGKSCFDCHGRSFCDSCHRIEVPHPAGFLKAHSSVAKQKGEEVCTGCHEKEDCVQCHERHVHPGGAVWMKRISAPK